MRTEELTVLLQCPKKYELKQVILDEEFQKYNVKKHALGMLAEYPGKWKPSFKRI